MDVPALLDWYDRVKRPLPWRATRDPFPPTEALLDRVYTNGEDV